MADVTLKYKGATIGELSESGNKTIKTAGKYCEADILLEYVKSAESAGLPFIFEETINITDDTRNNGNYTASKFGTEFGTDNANLDIENSGANYVCFIFKIDNNTSVASCGQCAVILGQWKPSVSRFCVGRRKDNAFSYLSSATETFRIANGSVIHKYVYKIS